MVCVNTPDEPPTLLVTADPDASAFNSVDNRLNGVAMNPFVPAASKKFAVTDYAPENWSVTVKRMLSPEFSARPAKSAWANILPPSDAGTEAV